MQLSKRHGGGIEIGIATGYWFWSKPSCFSPYFAFAWCGSCTTPCDGRIAGMLESWNVALFDKQLNTLAKYFSKADSCERFRKHFVYDNPKVEGDARKKSIGKMFETCCPSFVKHRWQYRYEVLTWVIHRAGFLTWLDPTSLSGRGPEDSGDPEYSFSDAEIKCLELLFNDKVVSGCFWALAHAMRLLCEWGRHLSGWMHGCHCHPTKEER